MKKVMQRIALITMCIVSAFSLFGCKKDENGDVEKAERPITPNVSAYDLDVIHNINVTAGTKDLISNGKSDYKIVIPETVADEETSFAANEIKSFLFQSSGAELEIVNESADLASSYNGNSKYIAIGDTDIARKAGIVVDKEELTRSGYRIVTQDNSVFLIGGGDFGTLYAAYEFLHHEVGFECYASDEISLVKNRNVKLHEFDVTDVPDFTYRMTNTGAQRNNNIYARRLRLNQEAKNGKIWMGPNGVPWHNTFAYMPLEEYYEEHSKWYSNDQMQLCFYAQGDEKEYELFFDTFMQNFIAVVEANPTVDNITITQQDVNVWCTCDACNADLLKYGTNSATIIKFCNKVSDALKEYFAEKGSDRQVNICFFAYHKTTEAPVTKDESGKYVPIDQDVVCRDNVYVFYAPILADYLRPFTDSVNRLYEENMDKWCVVSKHMYLWIYSTHFNSYFSPMDATNSMQENYQFAKAHGVSYLFDQSQSNNMASSDWITLKAYLNAKLAWDVQADMETLVDNFFTNYYKTAAEPMRNAFEYYRTWFEHLKTDKGIGGGIGDDMLVSEYFPFGTVNTFLEIFDEAYQAIEPLKNEDPETYMQLYDRICMETLVYRYYLIQLHFSYFSDTEIAEMKKSFKNDAVRLGITRVNELTDISELWTSWGLV